MSSALTNVAAIVTSRGGRTCHAAIVSRELDIPAVVGTDTAAELIAELSTVMVSCAQGDVGGVYPGEIPIEVVDVDMADVLDTATEIMVDVGNPALAFQNSFLPVAGLARMEFIIWESIRAYPMALLSPEAVSDVEARSAILEIGEHTSGEDYFVERLSEGVGTIAAAFCPRPVIVRMSDFKSNEYASPVGGEDFEPSEAKPMIGFRGRFPLRPSRLRGGFCPGVCRNEAGSQ